MAACEVFRFQRKSRPRRRSKALAASRFATPRRLKESYQFLYHSVPATRAPSLLNQVYQSDLIDQIKQISPAALIRKIN